MAAEGGDAETQQKDETKRHTYPLVRVSSSADARRPEGCTERMILDQ